ncbi:MAG: Uma2 family endonuclease, partial [Crocosphaera sp.]
AEAGIMDFWIVNLRDKQLETYSQPYQLSNGQYNYRSQQIYLPNDVINLPHFDNISLVLKPFFV